MYVCMYSIKKFQCYEIKKIKLRTACIYGKETLKLFAKFACHTILTFVKKNDPKLPCSEDKFQIPLIFEKICSWGSKISSASFTIEPRSFKSR